MHLRSIELYHIASRFKLYSSYHPRKRRFGAVVHTKAHEHWQCIISASLQEDWQSKHASASGNRGKSDISLYDSDSDAMIKCDLSPQLITVVFSLICCL